MVVMGRITAPFGVKGWLKIYALTSHTGNLCDYPVWWLGHEGNWREVRVLDAKVHANALVAQIGGVESREAAAALKGVEIGVPRQRLPDAKANEFYWADLIGLRVVNTQNHEFGRVVRMVETGANDVLVVADETGKGRETLIPFIADAVKKIDIAAGIVEVDWGEDY